VLSIVVGNAADTKILLPATVCVDIVFPF
jgi:hypothetical protein